jgi:acetolactate synthase-1/2/3 large subunit
LTSVRALQEKRVIMPEPIAPPRDPSDECPPSRGPSSRIYSTPEPTVLAEPEETAAAQVVSALAAAGVDTYFGVPGGPIIALFDAILKSPGVTLVESRHETNAAFAAAGYWRATGKVPAVVVTAGPGATNAVTGIVSAHLEQVPMVVICGDVAWASSGGVVLQSLGREGVGIEGMLSNVTRATVRVAMARSAASQATAALRAATNSLKPGPALLILPIDYSTQTTDIAQIESVRTSISSQIGDHVVIDVAEQLCRAKRPLVVVGAGCRPHATAVERMIEALRVPFVTTPRAKGVISEDHPYSLRNCGMAASWWARRYTAGGVDAALVLGTDLDDVSVGPTPPIGPDGTLIHVDLDPAVFNRNWPTKLAINCDLGPFAKHMREMARSFKLFNSGAADVMAEVTNASPFDCEGFRTDDSPHITPHRVIHDLETAAGPGATFVTDIGQHMLFGLHYLTATGPNSFVIHLGLGSMASGICSAIGLALGNRKRRVVCICGDGGMQMAGAEVAVALKLRLPIVYAIFNDARYNMVYHGHKQQFGGDTQWDSPWIDFVAWAGALGLPGARIDRPGQITADLLQQLTADGRPAVLDIRHDAAVRIRGAGRVEALQQMSSPSPPPPSSRSPASVRMIRPVPPPSSTRGPASVRFPGSVGPLSSRGPGSGRSSSLPPLSVRGGMLRVPIVPPEPPGESDE